MQETVKSIARVTQQHTTVLMILTIYNLQEYEEILEKHYSLPTELESIFEHIAEINYRNVKRVMPFTVLTYTSSYDDFNKDLKQLRERYNKLQSDLKKR